MFLSKLRLLNAVYRRNNVVQETIRKTKINFPAITQSVRTYVRFIDDDDDEMPVTRREPNKFASRKNESYGQRNRMDFNRPRFTGSQQRFTGNQSQKLRPLKYDLDELGELKKEFYEESEVTKNRTDAEIEEFRRKHEITVPRDVPKPIFTFNELNNLPPNVAEIIQNQNFVDCTPIQAQGMPIALSGKDMVGIAQTG